jgi:hypothetical protein
VRARNLGQHDVTRLEHHLPQQRFGVVIGASLDPIGQLRVLRGVVAAPLRRLEVERALAPDHAPARMAGVVAQRLCQPAGAAVAHDHARRIGAEVRKRER